MTSVPGVAGDGSRDLYHFIRSSLGIFRAKYETAPGMLIITYVATGFLQTWLRDFENSYQLCVNYINYVFYDFL